jgi:hypothetical protein
VEFSAENFRMKFIEPKVHGFIDYMAGVILIAAPLVFGFANAAEALIPPTFGTIQITYSLFTRYEFGFFYGISMRKHLMLDMIGGAVLVTASWTFGFASEMWRTCMLLGIFEILVAFLTRPYSQRRHYRHHEVRAHQ